jgi:hypothetical protein
MLNSAEHLVELLQKELGLENTRPLDLGKLPKGWSYRQEVRAGVEGQFEVLGRWVTLLVCLDQRFPRTLPKILLTPTDALGLLPHVDLYGSICYAGTEGVDLDTERPIAIIQEALKQAVVVLEDGLTGRNADDFLSELGAYWGQKAAVHVRSVVDPGDTLREIDALDAKGALVTLADNFADYRAFQPLRSSDHATRSKALYVPLESVDPQALLSAASSPAQARAYIRDHLSEENLRRLDNLGTKRKRQELVLLGIRRLKQDFVMLGLQFEQCHGAHPLHSLGHASSVQIVSVERCEKRRIQIRGGASSTLASKRALVIGCGSVGGHVAMGLAWAGFGHLTLIDPDKLSTENTFRHVLGYRGLGLHKVEALKSEILSKVPYITVETMPGYADIEIERGRMSLNKFDVVTIALGTPATERHLNEQLWAAGGPPAVFTWLEPLGIGGHAHLSWAKQGAGCFSCLYAGEDGELQNLANFVAPDQMFAQDDVGCGSRFTPFSASDAIRTADLCVSLATRCAIGAVRAPVLRSWKGDAEAFLFRGYKLSPRFELPESKLTLVGESISRPDCSVCR